MPFIDPPVIDFAHLITFNEEELEKYREALSSWGCFQLINHGMESIIDEMRKNTKQFFQLPMEEKLKRAKSAIILKDMETMMWQELKLRIGQTVFFS
ncbi:hypothetical protein M9H77_06250 [Catharanthus roseus]|uniref:Uncharacterized protein n=1 Tax=Catharanthus roseus TaxID=4058 RepID=A0ACC0BRQ1_CATRO|nr:hypothetical protein M9H77_06250 [Catharanthus roseus]